MARPSLVKITKATSKAQAGVDYSPRYGALCPWCGRRAKIYKTLPWEDRLRVRYHRCTGKGCVIVRMGITIKSIEVDNVEVVG